MNPLDKIADRVYYVFHGRLADSPTGEWFEVKLGFSGSFRGEGATLEEAVNNALKEEKESKRT